MATRPRAAQTWTCHHRGEAIPSRRAPWRDDRHSFESTDTDRKSRLEAVLLDVVFPAGLPDDEGTIRRAEEWVAWGKRIRDLQGTLEREQQ